MTAPRIPRHRPAVIPVNDRPAWYELTPFAAARIVLMTFVAACIMVACTLAPAVA